MSNFAERWYVDVKFKGRTHRLCGKLLEKYRINQRDLPRMLDVKMRAKLSVVPADGTAIKFIHQVSNNAKGLRRYLLERQCAICVHFPAAPHMYTLYLTCASLAVKIKGCDAIEMLKTEADNSAFVGILTKEVDPTLEDVEEERYLLPAATSLDEPLALDDIILHLELLLDRMSGSQSAIEACTEWILRHCHDISPVRISQMLQKFFCDQNTFKLKMNIIYLVHDILRNLRGSKTVLTDPVVGKELASLLQENIPSMVISIRCHKDRQHKLDEVLRLWDKWGIKYERPQVPDNSGKDDIVSCSSSEYNAGSPQEKSKLIGDSPTTVANVALHQEAELPSPAVKLIRKWHLDRDSAELLRRVAVDKIERVREALEYTDQYGVREGDISAFTRRFIEVQAAGASENDSPAASSLFLDSFVAAWNLDNDAVKVLTHVDEAIVTDMWLRLQRKGGVSNPSAYVVGTLRKIDAYKPNPELDTLVEKIKQKNEKEIIAAVSRFWDLDSGAVNTLRKLEKVSLLKLISKLVEINKKRPMKNPSCSAIRCIKELNLPILYQQPHQMRSSVNDTVGRLLGNWDASSSKKRKCPIDDSQYLAFQRRRLMENARLRELHDGVSYVEPDIDLEMLKKTIPPPPPLVFKKCRKKQVIRQETNAGGTLAVAPSGIAGAGYGLFNVSGKTWPALTVVCLFGSRRISHDEHHDGLNKVARCGELGETFVVVNGKPRTVEEFEKRYGHRLVSYDGLVDADGSIGGYPNDRVIGYPESMYWDASSFYNNSIIVPGCIIDTSLPSDSKIVLDQLYLITWKDVPDQEEFFLAYGTSFYPDDECNEEKKS